MSADEVGVAPVPGRPRTQWTKRHVIDRCKSLRQHLLVKRLATKSEVDEHRPAKSANKDLWWLYYSKLSRLHARAEIQAMGGGGSGGISADQRALAALQEKAVPVTLCTGQQVQVHPKSLHALLWFLDRDWIIALLGQRQEAFRDALMDGRLDRDQFPDPAATLSEIRDEIAYQMAIVVAQACTPGPVLDDSITETVPETWQVVDPVDVYQIWMAFREVNAGRMEVVKALTKPHKGRGGRTAAAWAVIVSEIATSQDGDVTDYLRNKSLVKLLMQRALAAPQWDPKDDLK